MISPPVKLPVTPPNTLGINHQPASAADIPRTACKYNDIWISIENAAAIPKKFTRYAAMSDLLTMIRLGANGSVAHSISTAANAANDMPKAIKDTTVSLSLHATFPPRSSPKRRKKMERTRVTAPPKSTRLILALKSEVDVCGKCS